jgi:hypothetical protein
LTMPTKKVQSNLSRPQAAQSINLTPKKTISDGLP